MSVSKALDAVAGIVGGYAPLDSGLLVPAAYLPSGTSFPAQPAFGNNRRFWRTDLGMEFYYDGTRWLCTCPHQTDISLAQELFPYSASAVQRATAPILIGSDVWIEKAQTWFYVSGGTALSALHKWVGVLTISNLGTTLDTVNVNSGASSTYRQSTIATVSALLGSGVAYTMQWTKTGTPGSLYAQSTIQYRHVAT